MSDQKGMYPNQLHRELMGVSGLSFSDQHVSASRKQMFSSHITQRLVTSGCTERYIQTGMEREYGKYTFRIEMPVDADIIKIIERYPRTITSNGIAHNPETLIIYEDADTKEIGCITVVDYFSNHQYFGFRYSKKSSCNQIRVGASIKKGTILADSPAITDQGGYAYGRECNVAFMSHPATSEDGVVISRQALEKWTFNTYETRAAEWGNKFWPLNLYGDENNYKPFPDIGDYVRPDGLLMAFMPHDETFSPIDQSVAGTQFIDSVFAKRLYAAGGGGKIIDIRVHHDPESVAPVTPVCESNPNMSMDNQAKKYDLARRRYHQEVVNTYNKFLKDRGAKLSISHEFHRIVTDSISVVGSGHQKKPDESTERVVKLYRGATLDDWRIEFVIEYTVTPRNGFKFTDTVGGKGVACCVVDEDQMPIDADGNRAEIVMDPGAVNNRMNPGRIYEQFYNATSRDLVKELRKTLDISNPQLNNEAHISRHPNLNKAWSRLLRFYEIIAPKVFQMYSKPSTNIARVMARAVSNECLYIYLPPNNEPEARDIVSQLRAEFPTTYGPVSYIGYSGKRCTTKKNVRIGSLYVMLLEKTGDDWTAVSSGKVQNFGVLSQLNVNDKYAAPTRNQAIRFDGETENRIITSYAGPQAAAEILDINNNISAHKSITTNIISANRPTDIERIIDRNKIPLGNARPLQLIKHYALCNGYEFTYTQHVPEWGMNVGSENHSQEV